MPELRYESGLVLPDGTADMHPERQAAITADPECTIVYEHTTASNQWVIVYEYTGTPEAT